MNEWMNILEWMGQQSFVIIINRRINKKMDEEISWYSFEFRKVLVLERPVAMQLNVQKCLDQSKSAFFIDFEKTFDKLKHIKQVQILENINLMTWTGHLHY